MGLIFKTKRPDSFARSCSDHFAHSEFMNADVIHAGSAVILCDLLKRSKSRESLKGESLKGTFYLSVKAECPLITLSRHTMSPFIFLDFATTEQRECLKYLRQHFKGMRANRFKIHAAF